MAGNASLRSRKPLNVRFWRPTQMEQHLQAIVTVLSLVNPLICGVMFAQVEAGQTHAIRITDATKAALAVLVILLVAALAGARVLQIFGVSLDAFSIAGGGVLTWIGFSMLRGNSSQPDTPRRRRCRETVTHAVDLVRGEPRHDYRGYHARCCACEAGIASHCTRRGRGRRGSNVGCYGACGPRRGSRKRRGQPAARHGDAVYGINRPRNGRSIRADRPAQFFRLRTLHSSVKDIATNLDFTRELRTVPRVKELRTSTSSMIVKLARCPSIARSLGEL